MSRITLAVGIVLAVGAAAARVPHAVSSAPSRMEGTFEYVGTLKGQSIMSGGRYVFLYGPSDGSAPMIGEAGSYRIDHDTSSHTITYSTDPARVGKHFKWTTLAWAGDTIAYVVMDEQRKEVGRGRAIRRK